MTTVIALAYLVAAVCFILGLKQLSSPKGARNGNFIAAIGMVIALVATLPLLHFTPAGLTIIAIGIVAILWFAGTLGIFAWSILRAWQTPTAPEPFIFYR